MVEAFDDPQRRQLLQFWSGSDGMPAEGFGALDPAFHLVAVERMYDAHDTTARLVSWQHCPGWGYPCDWPDPAASAAAFSSGLVSTRLPAFSLTFSNPANHQPSPAPHPLPPRLQPAAHTCFRQLDLPRYRSMEELRDKLFTAITIGQGYMALS